MARTRTPSYARSGCCGCDIGRMEGPVKEVKVYDEPLGAGEARA